jgi:hypothetical protein
MDPPPTGGSTRRALSCRALKLTNAAPRSRFPEWSPPPGTPRISTTTSLWKALNLLLFSSKTVAEMVLGMLGVMRS